MKLSSEFNMDVSQTPLAINMSILTNSLWYDLNKGFGAHEFPTAFDILIKSRIVLSKILTDNLADKFEHVKESYRTKAINDSQLADNILMLREEIKKPEDIRADELDEVLSVISEEKLEIHQSEKAELKNKLQKSEKQNEALLYEVKKGEEETEKVKKQSKKKDEVFMQYMQEQISDTEDRKRKADEKINRKMRKLKGEVIFLFVLYYSFIFYLLLKGSKYIKSIVSIGLSVLPPAVSIVIPLVLEKKLDILGIYKKIISFYKQKYTKQIYDEYCINIQKLNEYKSQIDKLCSV